MKRRIAILIVVCLAVGFVANILIAWWFASDAGRIEYSFQPFISMVNTTEATRAREHLEELGAYSGWYIYVEALGDGTSVSKVELRNNLQQELAESSHLLEGAGESLLLVARISNPGVEFQYAASGTIRKGRNPILDRRSTVPAHIKSRQPILPHGFEPGVWGAMHMSTQYNVGWPAPSLTYWYRDPLTISGGWQVENVVGDLLPNTDEMIMPYHLLWRGTVVNTVLFAAVLFLLINAPRGVRLLVRFQRGRCIRCGYDLRGDLDPGCPECGWNRASNSADAVADDAEAPSS